MQNDRRPSSRRAVGRPDQATKATETSPAWQTPQTHFAAACLDEGHLPFCTVIFFHYRDSPHEQQRARRYDRTALVQAAMPRAPFTPEPGEPGAPRPLPAPPEADPAGHGLLRINHRERCRTFNYHLDTSPTVRNRACPSPVMQCIVAPGRSSVIAAHSPVITRDLLAFPIN
jgi:hypothetical protein